MTLKEFMPPDSRLTPFRGSEEVIDTEVYETRVNGKMESTMLVQFSIDYPQQPPTESIFDMPFGMVYVAMERAL